MSIYVLRYGNLLKIGFSADLAARVKAIMASIPGDVSFVGHMPGERDVEQHLHGRFEGDRFSGEWFADSDRLRAFCDAALDPTMPEQVDRRASGNRRRREYPPYAMELRAAALEEWPETDHKARIASLAPALAWTHSRTKKLYYGEEAEITSPEADALRALATKIEARKAALK